VFGRLSEIVRQVVAPTVAQIEAAKTAARDSLDEAKGEAQGTRQRVAFNGTFVEGAKEGFAVAVGIVPYPVAMLVAVGVLRSSGALDQGLGAVRLVVSGLDGR
jgi:hypothetical protein